MEKQDISAGKKPPMSEEERLALAAKLDKDLEDFMENLPKREQPTGPLPENWLEEFDTHPFFMKKVPDQGEPMHPLYEGLQQLKYDPNENTSEELALSYKEDGNFNFKHKNYRLAVIAYTEGIKVKCGVSEIVASLHNNRSAAHWYLKNYRSSLRDAEIALKHNPEHEKAMHRAANCCFETQKFDECIELCDKILDKGRVTEFLELRKAALSTKKDLERNERRNLAKLMRKTQYEVELLEEIRKLGVNILGGCNLSMLQPQFLELADHRVSLNVDKTLVFPGVFMYPQYKTMDFIQHFPINSTFEQQLALMFAETPNWDVNKEYVVGKLAIYYEYDGKTKLKPFRKQNSLKQILQQPTFLLTAGTPCFFVTVNGSPADEKLLSSY